MRDRIVHRRLPRRPHADDEQVGALAGLERADHLLHPESARAADGCHLERRLGADRTRVVGH
jgi:hypothetical protein